MIKTLRQFDHRWRAERKGFGWLYSIETKRGRYEVERAFAIDSSATLWVLRRDGQNVKTFCEMIPLFGLGRDRHFVAHEIGTYVGGRIGPI